MSDRDVAKEVRRHVESAGGSRWVPVRWLRDAFGRGALTRKARTEIEAALADVDVLAEPALDLVVLEDDVRLYLSERARVRRPHEQAPAPVGAPGWTPPPPPPSPWQRFRRWPVWAQLGTAAAVLILIVALASGDSSDDGGPDEPQPAQQAGTQNTSDDAAAERERARERKRERAERKRERARERARERRERIRERRREREREEARERKREEERRRREREATPSPAESPDSSGDCEPGYSPCVPPYPPDLDCPDIGGPVTVTGSDPHGLDADNDGEGCES